MTELVDECKQGHALTDENVWIRPSDGNRVCRTCKNANDARWRARKRAEYRQLNSNPAPPDASQPKKCYRCQEVKPLSAFRRNLTKRDGRQDFCRDCMNTYSPRYTEGRRKYQEENRELIRARNRARYQADPDRFRSASRLRKYGVSDQDVQSMLDLQRHQCGICYDPINVRAHVDHDHKTGKVRGLLCSRCNTMLGHARDEVTNLTSAIGYLQHGPRSWAKIDVAVTLKESADGVSDLH